MNKVLLVDDHSDIRRLIRITLGKDFEVLEAEDGMTGLEIARKQKPDLVVLDVMMPGEMDGLQVLDAIKADPTLAQTRVIMVTARGQARDYEDGMQARRRRLFHQALQPPAADCRHQARPGRQSHERSDFTTRTNWLRPADRRCACPAARVPFPCTNSCTATPTTCS
jgi:CheY-like chemotaxis protein